MQARYYDPIIGRFYSNDPVDAVSHLGNAEGIKGFNRYSYAVNNPYKYTDPSGNEILPVGNAQQKAAINKSLTKIEQSNPKSAARIKTLRNSKNVHIVRFPRSGENPVNKTLPIKANESNGIGTGSETVVDVTKSLTTTNTDGSPVVNSGEAILAHELLGHGLDKDQGVIDRSVNPATGEKRSEESAMAAENEYKDAVGEKRRDCHSTC